MLTTDDVKFRTVELVPANDSDPAGGNPTETEITGASSAEVLPPMAAQESGTLGTDIERQYQGADIHNLSTTDNLVSPYFFVYGLIQVPVSAAKLRYVSTSSSDGATKKRRHWIKVGSSMLVEDVVLNGTSQVAGAQNAAEVYASRTLLASNDQPTTLVGDLTLSSGNSAPGTEIAKIINGYDWMTGQLDAGWFSTLSPTSTWTNRKTDPSVTYTRPGNLATAITCPVDIPAVVSDPSYGRLVFRQTLEPGMPNLPLASFLVAFGGDSESA